MRNNKLRSFFTLDKKSFYEWNNSYIKKVIEVLNKDKLVIIKWLRNVWKINFIIDFINKAKLTANYFYFNKSDDIENTISTSQELESLFNEYVKLYKNPKIIILQDISKIEGIKDFISNIYKQNYKTILVWNTIKIWWIKEIEILPEISINKENVENTIKYWTINEIKTNNSNILKEKILNLMISDIFLNDIFRNYWVKNIDLYNFTITYLAYNSFYLSLRDIQKRLEIIQNISLKTTIDYIDFSIQEKIIKRVYNYNFKTNKVVTSKAKYYFNNNWIRNCLWNFEVSEEILIENLVFNILELHNYKIFWWINWNFEFTFYWELIVNELENNKLFVHISKSTNLEDLMKEVNNLLRIWVNWKKYILIENAWKLWITQFMYDGVEIIEIKNFLEKF